MEYMYLSNYLGNLTDLNCGFHCAIDTSLMTVLVYLCIMLLSSMIAYPSFFRCSGNATRGDCSQEITLEACTSERGGAYGIWEEAGQSNLHQLWASQDEQCHETAHCNAGGTIFLGLPLVIIQFTWNCFPNSKSKDIDGSNICLGDNLICVI